MKRKIRILHIDDNIHDRKLVKDVLQKESKEFEVIEASSREKFEKHLNEADIDLVLSDFNILGYDGLQVIQLVKAKDPDLPVIIVTGTGSEEIAIQALKMGASDYVIKTVNHIRSLVPTIRTVLENKKASQERKTLLAAIHEREELYRSIYENSSIAILLTSPDGSVLSANACACDLFGRSEKEICAAGRDGLVDLNDPRLNDLLEERRKTGRAKGN
jgi:two-component system response regulator